MGMVDAKLNISLAAYLQLEDEAEEKSEFHNGSVLVREGLSYSHSLTSVALGAALFAALKDCGCQALHCGVKVWIEAANSMVYPDLMVVCGGPEFVFQRKDIICNPKVVIEVISPETANFDRGAKFESYKLLKSLREYVLVEQDSANVDVFHLNEDGQLVNESYSGLEAEVMLRSLGIGISMKDVYRDVEIA
jgi:Uma2 family endonuclease